MAAASAASLAVSVAEAKLKLLKAVALGVNIIPENPFKGKPELTIISVTVVINLLPSVKIVSVALLSAACAVFTAACAVVWADVVCPFVLNHPSYNWDVYGVVSDDKTTITFPYLQELEAGYFVGTNSSYSIIEEGEVVFELQEDGTWVTDDPYMVYAGNLYYGSIVMNASMTKN